MKDLLNKDFGPFDGKTWLIVLAGGLGLGWVMRKRFGVGTPQANTDDPTIYEVVGTTQPQVVNGGTNYNQGAIVADVIAQLGPRLNPVSPSPNPVFVGDDPADILRLTDGVRLRQSDANQVLQAYASGGRDAAEDTARRLASDGAYNV